MKKYYSLLLPLLMVFSVHAQIETPVTLNYTVSKIDALNYEIHIVATIQKGWHTYSQTTPQGGPLPTLIKFVKNPLVTFVGKAKEVGKLEQHYEKLFGVDVKQFSDRVEFVQLIKLKKSVKINVSGSIEYMVCDNVKCLPPSLNKFSVPVQ